MDHLTKKYRTMFVAAAWFNWTAALMTLKPSLLYGTMGVTPLPNEDMVLHFCSLCIFLYGMAYYSASNDFVASAPLVNFGMVAKVAACAVAALDVALGYVSWQVLPLMAPDLIFATLFYMALQDLNDSSKRK